MKTKTTLTTVMLFAAGMCTAHAQSVSSSPSSPRLTAQASMLPADTARIVQTTPVTSHPKAQAQAIALDPYHQFPLSLVTHFSPGFAFKRPSLSTRPLKDSSPEKSN